MKRFLGQVSAALLAIAALSTFTAPAMAGGGFSIGIGSGHGGSVFDDRRYGGITFGFDTRRSHRTSWRRHIEWCFDNHANYDPESNRYFNGHRWRHCRSPFL